MSTGTEIDDLIMTFKPGYTINNEKIVAVREQGRGYQFIINSGDGSDNPWILQSGSDCGGRLVSALNADHVQKIGAEDGTLTKEKPNSVPYKIVGVARSASPGWDILSDREPTTFYLVQWKNGEADRGTYWHACSFLKRFMGEIAAVNCTERAKKRFNIVNPKTNIRQALVKRVNDLRETAPAPPKDATIYQDLTMALTKRSAPRTRFTSGWAYPQLD